MPRRHPDDDVPRRAVAWAGSGRHAAARARSLAGMRESGILRNIGCVRVLVWSLPALTVLGGLVMIVAGFVQGPRDLRAATAFANDAGCRVDLITSRAAGGVAGSACRVVPVQILDAATNPSGARSQANVPFVRFTTYDGRQRQILLAGSDGREFVRQVYPDTPGRALLFQGEAVRIEANGVAADALSAPGPAAHDDAQLPWAGAGLAAFGLFLVWMIRVAQARL